MTISTKVIMDIMKRKLKSLSSKKEKKDKAVVINCGGKSKNDR